MPWDSFKQFGAFTLTLEDAKRYLYAKSSARRVQGWKDIQVKLYI